MDAPERERDPRTFFEFRGCKISSKTPFVDEACETNSSLEECEVAGDPFALFAAFSQVSTCSMSPANMRTVSV